MSDIVHWLRKLAALVEAQQAPHNLVLHMRAGADEIERLRGRLEIDPSHPYDGIYARDETIRGLEKEIARLRAGGCARDQGTTQYCAEAAKLATENERLRAALEEIVKQAETARKNVAYRKRIKFYENPLNEARDEGALQAHEILADIARAALEGK